jgi:hypothetical protein
MKYLCKNAIFGIRINITLSNGAMTGIATGTTVCLRALPLPAPLKIRINPRNKAWSLVENAFLFNLEKLA